LTAARPRAGRAEGRGHADDVAKRPCPHVEAAFVDSRSGIIGCTIRTEYESAVETGESATGPVGYTSAAQEKMEGPAVALLTPSINLVTRS